MRCLILAALIGLCAASTLYQGGRKIYFTDDDNVFVHGLDGQYFTFTRVPGQQYIDVVINGVDTPMKRIRINGQTCQVMNLEGFKTEQYLREFLNREVYNQGQIYNTHLFEILRNFQGVLDETKYSQVLNIVKTQVEEGKICQVIYHLLAYLDKLVNEETIQKYFVNQGRKVYFTDADNVLVNGLNGQYFTFTRFPGQQYIDVVINGVDTPMKKIRIDGQTCQVLNLEGFKTEKYFNNQFMTQGQFYDNYFFNVLRNYEGVLDNTQYEQLLKLVKTHVEEGKICHVIYHLLAYLDKVINEETIQKYFVQQQHQQYPVGQYKQYPVGQYKQYPVGQYEKYQQYPVGQYEQYQQYPVGQFEQQYKYQYPVGKYFQHQNQYPVEQYFQNQYYGGLYKNVDTLSWLNKVWGNDKVYNTRYNYGFYPYNTEKYYNTKYQTTYPYGKQYQQPMEVYGHGYDNQVTTNDVVYPTTQYGYGNTHVIDYLFGRQFQGLNNQFYGRGFGRNYAQNIYGY